MLSHEQIWSAIDHLAQRNNLTASGLAKRAGLDATSFNRSKRISPDGRKRWPSTESVAKILAATGASLDDFLRMVGSQSSEGRSVVPLIASDSATGQIGANGLPGNGSVVQEVEMPGLGQESCFAIEARDGALTPLYRDGDLLVVSPTAAIRKGDRVVTCLGGGAILAAELKRRTARSAELIGPIPGEPDRVIPTADIAWMARVMWVRQ